MNTSLRYGMYLCSLIAFCIPLAAQMETPELATDRPDQTESSALVPPGSIQVEIGVLTERTQVRENGLDLQQTVNAYPDVLVRYGLLPAMELRVVAGYQQFSFAGESISGAGPLSIGTKLAICSEEGLRPEVAFIGHITLPWLGREEFRTSFIAPQFRFAASHTLSDIFSIGYNLGMEWDGESALATGIYTAVLGIAISDEIGAFAEVFGGVPEMGESIHSIDGGFTYALLPNVQLDASAGFGLTETSPEYFVGAGLSFRLPR